MKKKQNLELVKDEEFIEEEVDDTEEVESESEETVEVVPNKKGKVMKVIKAVGYGVAFIAGVAVTLFLSKSNDDDSDDDEIDIDSVNSMLDVTSTEELEEAGIEITEF